MVTVRPLAAVNFEDELPQAANAHKGGEAREDHHRLR
jgi:hypothetical protein